MAAAGDSLGRDGDVGSAPTMGEHARVDGVDIIHSAVGVHDGEGAATCGLGNEGDGGVSDPDDEEYTAPLDELLASDDSDDPMDDVGSEDERGGDGVRAEDDEGGDDVATPTGKFLN